MLYIYIWPALFLVTLALETSLLLYRNGVFSSGLPRAEITETHGAVLVRIQLQRPLKIKPGQYINLWIPSVSFWSFMQTHPFVVVSWVEGYQYTLDLLIQPRKGLTRDLVTCHPRTVLFTGPHGISAPIDEYEHILMVAGGVGIIAQLPYLNRLVYNHSACNVRTRRVHLVWHVQDLGRIGNLGSKPLQPAYETSVRISCAATAQ